jgi:class 3 adenylate cyclase
LPIYTFLAILFAIAATAALVVPFILRAAEREYLVLQSDINRRQANALARFVEFRLAQGTTEDAVIQELNSMLLHAEADRGYSCVISQDDGTFLSHPKPEVVGMPVSAAGASFARIGHPDSAALFESVVSGDAPIDGLLFMPGERREVVAIRSIPAARWTIATHENTRRIDTELSRLRARLLGGFAALAALVAVPASYAARKVGSRYEAVIENRNARILAEQAKSETLLLNILPARVAEELKSGKDIIAERREDVSVLFADIVGFTPLASQTPPEELVGLLNTIFSGFDDLVTARGLEKIKTIGDAYMVCGGLPEPLPGHLVMMADLALAMRRLISDIGGPTGHHMQLRIGMDFGPVVAGVIGKHKFSYDVWGDVVNTASRMESTARPGSIHVTPAVERALRGQYEFAPRGPVAIRGKAAMNTFELLREMPG